MQAYVDLFLFNCETNNCACVK